MYKFRIYNATESGEKDGEALTVGNQSEWTISYNNGTYNPATAEVVIEDLAPGRYVVEEQAAENGATPSESTKVVTVTDGNTISDTATAAFVNNVDVGTLKVTKTVTVDGNAPAADSTFVTKDFKFTVKSGEKYLQNENGSLGTGAHEFTVKHGNTVTFANLPVGSYTVAEVTGEDNANISVSGYNVSITGQSQTADVTKNQETENTITNAYEINTGDLLVKKSVVSHTTSDKTKDFNFTVTLQPTDNFAGENTYGDMTFTDGVAHFTLKDGEQKKATGLPVGTQYTVQEDDAEGFTKTTPENASGSIVKDEEATVEFVNTRQEGNLAVNKKVVSSNAAKLNQEFTFTVTLSDRTITGTYGDMTFNEGVATIKLKHDETKTATGLPAKIGYKVEEAAVEKFEVQSDNAESVIDQGETKTAHFTNTDTEVSVQVKKVDITSQKELAGAHLMVIDSKGNIVAEWDSTTEAHEVTGLTVGETYTLRETVAPKGYSVTVDTTFVINKDGTVSGTTKVGDSGANKGILLVEDKAATQGTGSVKVTKYTLKNDGAFKVVSQTFYTALFSDSGLTNRVSDIKPIVLSNQYTNEVTFTGLPFGTYYVGETDATGKPMKSSATVTKVEITNGTAQISGVNPSANAIIKNTMAEGVLGAYVSVNLNVSKKVVDSSGNAKKTNDTFYFALFSDAGFKNRIRGTGIQSVKLNNQSSGSTVFRSLPYTDEIYVAEVDKSGKVISGTKGFSYKVSYSGNGLSYARADGGTITVTNKSSGGNKAGANRKAESENKAQGQVANSVRTGDQSPIVPLLVTMLLAAAAALFLFFYRKRMKR